jgi:hypothetical protein
VLFGFYRVQVFIDSSQSFLICSYAFTASLPLVKLAGLVVGLDHLHGWFFGNAGRQACDAQNLGHNRA